MSISNRKYNFVFIINEGITNLAIFPNYLSKNSQKNTLAKNNPRKSSPAIGDYGQRELTTVLGQWATVFGPVYSFVAY